MRKTILLITGLIALTSCQKDYSDEFIAINEVNAAQATLIESLQEQINALVNALAEQTANLQEAIATNSDNIDANADAINLANQSIATNLTAIGQVSNTLTAEVINLFNTIESTETSLLNAIQTRADELLNAINTNADNINANTDASNTNAVDIANNNAANISALANAIALLRSEINAAQATAIAYADANDSDTVYDDTYLAAQINTVSSTLASATADLQAQINDLVGRLTTRVDELTVAIQAGDDSNADSLNAAIETLRGEIAAAQAAAEAYADANDTDTDTVYDDSAVRASLITITEQVNLLSWSLSLDENNIVGRVVNVNHRAVTIQIIGTTAKVLRFNDAHGITSRQQTVSSTFTLRKSGDRTPPTTNTVSSRSFGSVQQTVLYGDFRTKYSFGDVIRVTAE